jgi:iron(II)-dependent oxidoreductase
MTIADAHSVDDLIGLLDASRARTLRHVAALADNEWMGPYLTIVNPPLWEIGHLGWFHEHWCLRYAPGRALAPSLIENADARYNSARIAHADRWRVELPDARATLDYLARVQDAIRLRLAREGATPHLDYFVQLSVFHEDMHNEAFDCTRQTHGRPPAEAGGAPARADTRVLGDAAISGGRFMLGAQPGAGFVFDNEKWAHPVEVQPFCMSRTAVSNSDYAQFVLDGGYRCRAFWCDAGWRWRESTGAQTPVYWKIEQKQLLALVHGQWCPLQEDAAVIHVNWYEAQAYCRWAKRRLPSEAEWEFAASTVPRSGEKRRYPWGDESPDATRANLYGGAGAPVSVHAHAAGDSAWGVRQMWGNVWEWTSTTFNAYPGFVRDPYQEYSEPWFGTHKVLRGGCHATAPCLLRNTWRNFYTPDRRDVLAGFRTCAL